MVNNVIVTDRIYERGDDMDICIFILNPFKLLGTSQNL